MLLFALMIALLAPACADNPSMPRAVGARQAENHLEPESNDSSERNDDDGSVVERVAQILGINLTKFSKNDGAES